MRELYTAPLRVTGPLFFSGRRIFQGPAQVTQRVPKRNAVGMSIWAPYMVTLRVPLRLLSSRAHPSFGFLVRLLRVTSKGSVEGC